MVDIARGHASAEVPGGVVFARMGFAEPKKIIQPIPPPWRPVHALRKTAWMIAGARWVNRSAAKGAGGVAVRIHGDVLKLDIMIMVNVD